MSDLIDTIKDAQQKGRQLEGAILTVPKVSLPTAWVSHGNDMKVRTVPGPLAKQIHDPTFDIVGISGLFGGITALLGTVLAQPVPMSIGIILSIPALILWARIHRLVYCRWCHSPMVEMVREIEKKRMGHNEKLYTLIETDKPGGEWCPVCGWQSDHR